VVDLSDRHAADKNRIVAAEAADALELNVYLAVATPAEKGRPIQDDGEDEESDEDDKDEEADCDFLHCIAVFARFFRI
jgi:hypothetical protein